MGKTFNFDDTLKDHSSVTASIGAGQEFDSYQAAHRFMLNALLAVHENLPSPAKEAVSMEKMFMDQGVDAKTEEEMRASLWNAIAGRKMDESPEVLGIRATICILFLGCSEPPSAPDALEFFIETFNAARLSYA